jgi:hypothetical protein
MNASLLSKTTDLTFKKGQGSFLTLAQKLYFPTYLRNEEEPDGMGDNIYARTLRRINQRLNPTLGEPMPASQNDKSVLRVKP